jgi:hypothetical protein
MLGVTEKGLARDECDPLQPATVAALTRSPRCSITQGLSNDVAAVAREVIARDGVSRLRW